MIDTLEPTPELLEIERRKNERAARKQVAGRTTKDSDVTDELRELIERKGWTR